MRTIPLFVGSALVWVPKWEFPRRIQDSATLCGTRRLAYADSRMKAPGLAQCVEAPQAIGPSLDDRANFTAVRAEGVELASIVASGIPAVFKRRTSARAIELADIDVALRDELICLPDVIAVIVCEDHDRT